MNKIYVDYLKLNRAPLIRTWIIAALELVACACVWYSNGAHWASWTMTALSAFVIYIALYTTLEVTVFEKRRLQAALGGMPPDERESLLAQYEKARSLGNRKFLDEYVIYFCDARIFLLNCRDIRSAELKGYKLLLDIGKKKPLKMPFGVDENPAVLVAAMRSRNPGISVILNGKVVEKMENNK